MQTNYGNLSIPIMNIEENNTIKLESENFFSMKSLVSNGYCIFRTEINILEDILKCYFDILPQNSLGLKRMPVTPIGGEKNLVHTREEQPLHSDNAHSDNPPDFICLFCEKNSKYGGDSIIKKLDESFLSERLAPLFLEKVKYRKNGKEHEVLVLEIEKGVIQSRYSPFCDYYELQSIEQHTALKEFHSLLSKNPLFTYKLSSGEAIILDNKRFLHGRTKFVGNRKIIRLWMNSSDK